MQIGGQGRAPGPGPGAKQRAMGREIQIPYYLRDCSVLFKKKSTIESAIKRQFLKKWQISRQKNCKTINSVDVKFSGYTSNT